MNNRVAGIILAAGESKRLGSPKQLLMFRGKSLIYHAIDLAIASQLDPVVVVLGAYYEDIKSHLDNKYNISIIQNLSWKEGQSTSLVKGIDHIKGLEIPAVILLCDQPELTPEIIRGIIDVQKSSKVEIVMVNTKGKRTPPVLFTPTCFPKIANLTGDRGARDIVDEFSIDYFINNDDNKMQDIDTYTDFENLNK